MKILLQKLPLTINKSFVARTYKTPNFEVSWHHHTEYELILFTSGDGMSFVGNHVGEFKTGDIFFLGKDLPHTFQKSNINQVTSAIVVQFNENFLGNSFLELPESNNVIELFKISTKGLKVRGQSKKLLTQRIIDLEHAKGFDRIICLCNCLNILAKNNEFNTLSSQHAVSLNQKNGDRIEKIIQYIICLSVTCTKDNKFLTLRSEI